MLRTTGAAARWARGGSANGESDPVRGPTARVRDPFVLDNATTPDKPVIDAVLGGVALLDSDGDGRLDVFFTNGARILGLAKDDPRYWKRLYQNEGKGTFRDVTAPAGVRGEGYSMGATAADFETTAGPTSTSPA